MKIKRQKIEAFVQMILLIVAVFAFAYIVKEAFQYDNLVSAQEPLTVSPEEDSSDDSFNDFFNALSEEGYEFTDSQIREAMNYFDTPEQMSRALENYNGDLNAATAGETVSPELLSLMQFFSSIIPPPPQINGGDIMQSFSEFSGGGVYVCPQDNNGAFCQTYLANECSSACDVGCVEVDISTESLPADSDCALGTCFDPSEGICQDGSKPGPSRGGGAPKAQCEDWGNDWYALGDREAESLCAVGCCLMGGQGELITETRCQKLVQDAGLSFGENGIEFKASITGELECIGAAQPPEEGACVFGEDNCKFTTREGCRDSGGDFNKNYLCSNPEINGGQGTRCERQNTANCIEGRDEIYWFDSCGNRENIYDADLDKSWNGGLVLDKSESCELGTASNPIQNQGICGNCNRFLSTSCGNKTVAPPIDQKLDDSAQEVVCLDMGCYEQDFLGNWQRTRENDESWCAYHSSIGLPGNDMQNPLAAMSFLPNNPLDNLGGMGGILPGFGGEAHGTDTPGSAHFRKYCQDGVISTVACDSSRNQICIEQQTPKGVDTSLINLTLLQENPEAFFERIGTGLENFDLFAGSFSQASCRINRWGECFDYMPKQAEGQIIGMAGESAGKILKAKLDLTCGMDPDCYVKTVKVDDKFEFSYCVPRYTPGFDMIDNPESGDQLCHQGSQMCTAVIVKKARGGGFAGAKWECESNCDCIDYSDGDEPESAKPSKKFINELNSFCVSLGDCGSQVNYRGDSPGAAGFNVKAVDCDIEKEHCDNGGFGGLGDIAGGLSGGIPGLGSLAGGVSNYPEDANPTQGEFVQSNSHLGDTTGNWINGLLSDLGLGDLFGGLGGGDGVPSYNHGLEIGVAEIGGVIGASGTLAYSVSVAMGYTTTALVSMPTAGTALVSAGTIGTPFLPAFGGALIGAAAGMALTSFLMDAFGIGPGLDSLTSYTMLAAGAVGGGFIAVGIVAKGLSACLAGGLACVIGIIIIIIVIIWMTILKFVFGVGEVRKVEVSFDCNPWVPPIGGNCELCGDDGMSDGSNNFPCSKYACQTLGQNCVYVEESEVPEKGGLCISQNLLDVNAPKITSLREDLLKENFEYGEFNPAFDKEFEIRKIGGGECVDQFEKVSFGFELDEHGRCSISAGIPESFDEMFSIGGLSKNHSFEFNSLDLANLGLEDLLNIEERNDITLYLACQDYFGHNNVNNPYKVNLCVIPGDIQAVAMMEFANFGGFLPYDAELYEYNQPVNEPAECRWAYEDIDFDDMDSANQCTAEDNPFGGDLTCTLRIPISESSVDICIKCKDHPEWEGTEREDERNENLQCKKQTFTRSEGPLQVEIINPVNEETIKFGAGSLEIEVVVETSGGVDGSAICSYKIDGMNGGVIGPRTSRHTQCLGCGTVGLNAGIHNLEVSCDDEVNPVAEDSAIFTLEQDNVAPEIVRVYRESGELILVSDESAECAYTNGEIEGRNGACNFGISEAGSVGEVNLMSVLIGSEGFRHSMSFSSGKTYYIKCRDEWNEPTGCNLIASGWLI